MHNVKNYLTINSSYALTAICRKIRNEPIISATIAVAALGSALYLYTRESSTVLPVSPVIATGALAGGVDSVLPSPSSGLENATKKCVPRITHLANAHWVKGVEQNAEAYRLVFHSQQKIVQYFLDQQDSKAIIFEEGMTDTFSEPFPGPLMSWPVEGILFEKNLQDLVNLFNQGTNISQLLYIAGFKCQVRRSISLEKNSEILKEIERLRLPGETSDSPRLRHLVCDQREQELVNEVQEFLRTTTEQNPEIVIIFGAGHDLSKYFVGQDFTRIDTTV
jgi:hypothetical protein